MNSEDSRFVDKICDQKFWYMIWQEYAFCLKDDQAYLAGGEQEWPTDWGKSKKGRRLDFYPGKKRLW